MVESRTQYCTFLQAKRESQSQKIQRLKNYVLRVLLAVLSVIIANPYFLEDFSSQSVGKELNGITDAFCAECRVVKTLFVCAQLVGPSLDVLQFILFWNFILASHWSSARQ